MVEVFRQIHCSGEDIIIVAMADCKEYSPPQLQRDAGLSYCLLRPASHGPALSVGFLFWLTKFGMLTLPN